MHVREHRSLIDGCRTGCRHSRIGDHSPTRMCCCSLRLLPASRCPTRSGRLGYSTRKRNFGTPLPAPPEPQVLTAADGARRPSGDSQVVHEGFSLTEPEKWPEALDGYLRRHAAYPWCSTIPSTPAAPHTGARIRELFGATSSVPLHPIATPKDALAEDLSKGACDELSASSAAESRSHVANRRAKQVLQLISVQRRLDQRAPTRIESSLERGESP